jgi:hypothetical protein
LVSTWSTDRGGDAKVHLYQGTGEQFIADAMQARLAGQLAQRYFDEFRYKPAPSEVTSWQNLLRAMANVLQLADRRDQGILVELKLPLTSKRLDVMVTGSNPIVGDAVVIVELRTRTRRSPDGAIDLQACSYLHNAQFDAKSPLYADGFESLLALNPLFAGNQSSKLADFLDLHVSGLDDGSVLRSVAATAFKPGKRLLDHVAKVIANEPAFVLLDEQLVTFNAIVDSVRAAGQNKREVAFLVQGGPGTGKSVIATNLVAELSKLGLRTLHLTGSKAFTENLRKIVGVRAGVLFKYSRDTATVTTDFKLDVAVLDEAHRIRTISTNRFTPAKARNGKAQIDDILDSTRTAVFFIDDLRVVRPGEVGSTDLIREAAAKRSIEVREFELEAQFRSNGSDSFIQWVDNTLELARTPQVLWPMDDEFDFRIVASVRELDRLIRERAGEGATARLVAGFCWPWSNPDENGELVPDVKVGDWEMPWNAQAGSGKLALGIPKSDFWASDPNGIEQVGCVYTAQGFEFDYVGVIFGPDLVYRPMDGGWVGQPRESFDRVVSRGVTTPEFTTYVKSTYRVLLTRGLRGCFISFTDPPTRDFFATRTERIEFHWPGANAVAHG